MIQYLNMAIDTVQAAKTNFVNTFVTNEEIKKPLQTYIDAQTSFAKKLAVETNNFVTTVTLAISNVDTKKAFATK